MELPPSWSGRIVPTVTMLASFSLCLHNFYVLMSSSSWCLLSRGSLRWSWTMATCFAAAWRHVSQPSPFLTSTVLLNICTVVGGILTGLSWTPQTWESLSLLGTDLATHTTRLQTLGGEKCLNVLLFAILPHRAMLELYAGPQHSWPPTTVFSIQSRKLVWICIPHAFSLLLQCCTAWWLQMARTKLQSCAITYHACVMACEKSLQWRLAISTGLGGAWPCSFHAHPVWCGKAGKGLRSTEALCLRCMPKELIGTATLWMPKAQLCRLCLVHV